MYIHAWTFLFCVLFQAGVKAQLYQVEQERKIEELRHAQSVLSVKVDQSRPGIRGISRLKLPYLGTIKHLLQVPNLPRLLCPAVICKEVYFLFFNCYMNVLLIVVSFSPAKKMKPRTKRSRMLQFAYHVCDRMLMNSSLSAS